MMKRIFLVGYMGSGKTTIGRELSKKLGFEFIDTDIYIENRFHKTINEIFATMGEEKFREIETNILKEVSDFENVIIAVGGGTPCFNNNMEIMKEKGTVIFLNPDLDELTYRLNLVKATRQKQKCAVSPRKCWHRECHFMSKLTSLQMEI